MFIPTWGNDPIWRTYFSNRLVQPPTRMDRMSSDLIDLILSSNQDGQLHFGEFAAALHLTALRRQVAWFLTGSQEVVLMEEIPNNHLVCCQNLVNNGEKLPDGFFPFLLENNCWISVCSWNIVDPFSLSLCVLVAPRNVFFGGGFKYFSLSWENDLIWLFFFKWVASTTN